MFIAVDKKRIFTVKKEIPIRIDPKTTEEYKNNILGYVLGGIVTEEFYVPFERCVEVEQEYAIVANLYGLSKANIWAREKGYIE